MASPWATRIAACSSRSPLSLSREIFFTPTVQGKINPHLQQANASLCGRKISLDPLSWWHMMAIWDKQHIGAYATQRSLTNTQKHHKRAVVSLIKARIIFTNRTKKRNPTKPNSAKPTHLDECMAQPRRETLNYAQGTYSYSYYVLARFLGRFARSIATISVVFRVYVKLIIDPWINHLQDHPMGRNLYTLVHIPGALHPRRGVAIRHVLWKLQSSSSFKWKGAFGLDLASLLFLKYCTKFD
jgi:hypothetical protein